MEHEDLWAAVQVMVANDLKHLKRVPPIVRDGRLVGLVTRHDLLKCILAEPAGTDSVEMPGPAQRG